MVCKTVKPTIITDTDRENVSYLSYCFYFTCMLQTLYNTLFFKVLYIFVKIVQHKQETRREKTTFFKIQKKNKKQAKRNATFWTSEALYYMQTKNQNKIGINLKILECHMHK